MLGGTDEGVMPEEITDEPFAFSPILGVCGIALRNRIGDTDDIHFVRRHGGVQGASMCVGGG